MTKTISPLIEPPVSKGDFFKIATRKIKITDSNFMEKLLNKCGPKDIIAILVIFGAFILKFKNIDGTASMILIGICAAYFGTNYFQPQKTDVSTSNKSE